MKTGKNAMKIVWPCAPSNVKKLLTGLLTLVLVTVTACNGGKDASTQQPAPSGTAVAEQTPKSSPTDNNSEQTTTQPESTSGPESSGHNADELRNVFVEAYMGLTENGEGVYYAGSSDGKIGLLMFLNGDTNEHYVFVGPVVDNGNGMVTITDEQDGLTLTFSVKALADGIEIDMGEEMGTAVLGETTVEEVLNAMIQIESNTTAVVPGRHDADELKNVFVEAYMGLTEGGAGVYYAGSSDGKIGLLMFLNGDTAEHYVFVGPVVDNGNGTVTITDEQDGLTLTFSVKTLADGIEIDMGDELGTAVLGDASVEEVIDVMLQIESGTTAVDPS